jgi:hypothetical protein
VTHSTRNLIEVKRKYRWLDDLLPDTALARAIGADPTAADPNGPLTLVGCLVNHHYQESFPPRPTLMALNGNLGALRDKIKKPGQLRKKLMNPSQFLNTISELALARTLLDNGYEITVEYEFAEKRDVDIFASKSGDDYHIDVTNLAARAIRSDTVLFESVSKESKYDLVIKKIATKFREKFEGPLERGWIGHAWIALDVAKNDLENVKTFVQCLTRPTWADEIRAILCYECPTLEGALLYRSDATATHVDIVYCLKCAA